MATLKFFLQSKKESSPIYVRLSISRDIVLRRKTGLNIDFKEWSDTTKMPKQTSAANKNLTTDLQKLELAISQKLNEAQAYGKVIDGDWLKYTIDIHFNRITENGQSDLVTDAIQEVIDSADLRENGRGGIGLSLSRINSYKGLKRILIDYQGKRIFRVKEVNVKFAKDFLKYLIHTRNYQHSYAIKKIADLKTVCFDAETNGVEVNHQLKKISSGKSNNENIIYLNISELEKIENAKILSPALQNARKWLLLGCSIGQRGGDLLDINENNFINRNGLDVIELRQQKTGKNVTIPILEKTRAILEDGLPYKISIQKFNTHLKKICELSEIDELIPGKKFDKETMRKKQGIYPKHELIGSHVCRRSFASNLYGTLPTALIMQITAHSTEKMLLNYIGKDSLDYAQQIADFYTLQALRNKKESNLTIVKEASNQY
ncbi:MAG: phage integrase SAM-like domain-containing protein [Aequorivita sp.]|nr:phage integrase SAM-like domain-containing protein [Aequorivita sp.]